MGIATTKERWILLAKQFQENVNKDKPWIIIGLETYRGTKNTLKYFCQRHNYHGEASGAALKKSKGCPQCQSEDHLYKSDEFPEMVRQKEAAKFIIKALKLHGDKYTYNTDWYASRDDALTKIWCNTHQEFFYQRPAAHLQGQNCPKCGKESFKASARHSQEDFISLVLEVNQNTLLDFSASRYVHMHEKVEFSCSKHGVKTKAANFLIRQSQPCEECNVELKQLLAEKEFIRLGKIIHNDQYDYSLIQGLYKTNRTKLPIICKVHNTVSYITKNHHIDRKQGGCKECAKLVYGRWNVSTLKKNLPHHYNKPCCTYLLKIKHNDATFYKVGITSDIEVRTRQILEELREAEIQCLIQSWSNVVESVLLEKYILKSIKHKKYEHCIRFGGYTECFQPTNVDLLTLYHIMSSPV